MKKKRGKRLLSFLLSAVIVLSSLTVGFYAIAATPEEEESAVSAVEESIQSFYDNHRNNLYSTNTSLKDAAREAFNNTSSEIKNLSDEEKLQIKPSVFAYWLTVVQDDVARTELGLSKTPTSAQRYTVLSTYMSKIEDVIGKFPTEQKDVFEAFAPFAVDINGSVLASTKLVYKDNQLAQDTLDSLLSNLSNLTASGFRFSDYLLPINSGDGGFYFNQTKPDTDKTGNTIKNVVSYVFLEQQSINDCTTPRFNYTEQVVRTGTRPDYVYSWAEGKSAETYFEALDAYEKEYIKNVVEPSGLALDIVLDTLDKVSDFKGVKEAATEISDVAVKYLTDGTYDFNALSDAVEKVDALSEDALYAFDAIGASSIAIYAKITTTVLGVEYTVENITPEIAYSKLGYYVTDVYSLSKLLDTCYTLVVNEFNKYVESIDLSKVTDDVIKAAKSRYAALPNGYQSSISEETLVKFMQVIKPAADSDDFADEIANFKQTSIIRPEGCDVAWTVGGIQSAVDKLWDLVANTLVPLIAKDVDLSNGLGPVLEENLYTVDTIEKIFDLYASLSHNTTKIEEVGMDLGTIISLLITPYGISSQLEEEKFAAAVEKIAPCQNNPSGKLDALAAVEFSASDFGFEDGDYEGFLDALLAVLRPITTLLAPNAKAAGIISVGVQMFDYPDENGEYVSGVYSNLIPLLEQLGAVSLPTAEEYKANYMEVAASSKNIAADEFLRPIINALYKDVITPVCNDPLNGLIKVLPRIAYVIGTDLLNDSVKAALAQTGILSGLAGSLDLTADSLNKLISGAPIDLSGIIGSEFKLQLKSIDWMLLANCCTVESMPSASNTNKYFILRTGETDTCFTTVFYYIYDVAFANADNYAAIRSLIADNLGGLSGIVTGYTDKWVEMGKEAAYHDILCMLGTPGDEWIDPDTDNNGGGDNGGDNGGNNSGDNGSSDNSGNNTDKNGNTDNDKNNGENSANKTAVKSVNIPNTGAEKVAYTGIILLAGCLIVFIALYCVKTKRKSN